MPTCLNKEQNNLSAKQITCEQAAELDDSRWILFVLLRKDVKSLTGVVASMFASLTPSFPLALVLILSWKLKNEYVRGVVALLCRLLPIRMMSELNDLFGKNAVQAS